MIDPEKITNYNLTVPELEEHLLFWICAAGKNGRTAARCLDRLLNEVRTWTKQNHLPLHRSPFKLLRQMHSVKRNSVWLSKLMQSCGIGCYNTKSRAFIEAAESYLNLRTCSPQDLERIHGVGQKSSRCFVLHSRKNARVAGLDTHLLKYLRSLGYDAPKTTPTGRKYLQLEQDFLKLADEAGVEPAVLDLQIWNEYSIKNV